MKARDRAIAAQLSASDPGVSAFVAASAGSGKTKLLTDRMLRLMLGGAHPSRIQCLTFTKAAAAEMALRLQHRLGRWVTLDDAALDQELSALLVPRTADTRRAARALFADVLDLPGGMRIGTIHAFCQSLLRRFPLEAAISPHFALVEEAETRAALDQAREGVLATADPAALAVLAGLADAATFAERVTELAGARPRLDGAIGLAEPRLRAAIQRVTGAGTDSEDALLAGSVAWSGDAALADMVRLIAVHGTAPKQAWAHSVLGWLALPGPLRVAGWDGWRDDLLIKDGSKGRAPSTYAGDKLVARYLGIMDQVAAEQVRVMAIEGQRRAIRAAEAAMALLTLATPILRDYEGQKATAGQLDYGDLIARTSQLLVDPGAAWVLYKLDGGIDHLLLDEVQDTAPAQWQIAHRLTDEFFAGLGAKGEQGRTFFAVGDPKQSIYSFQGADPAEFDRSRAQMEARVGQSGTVWRDVALDVSFRSTAPVLALVDAVFSHPDAAAGVSDGDLHHDPDRAGAAGRVELWPLAPVPPAAESEPWAVPERNQGQVSAPQRLADALAGWIAGEIADGIRLESRGRAVTAGDFLILVRRRNNFARSVVRALKVRGVAVAGLDRLELTAQAAVQDLMAACDAVLLPQDDLTVACVLTSPLGGLTDDSLMRLSMGRDGSLWDTLRARAPEREAWGRAWSFLSTLSARADHVTPHALLTEALGALGGRARLLARLGPEAAEPIDELLQAALLHGAHHPPSLQGFLHWLRRSGAMVKREAGGAGGAVRVMTVHGAKGLQAPIVVLPDTTALPPEDAPFVWMADGPTGAEIPVWVPRKELRCPATDAAREEGRRQRMREYNRLLYVALTRAEDRLVVCGWETRKKVPDASWYRMVEAGLALLKPEAVPFEVPGAWEGAVQVHRSPQRDPAVPERHAAHVTDEALPAWAGRPGDWQPAPPPPEPPLPVPLAPSRPEGAAFGPVPGAASPLLARGAGERFQQGRLVHTLLQHLPDLAPEGREAASRAYLAQAGHALAPGLGDAILNQVMAVLAHPSLVEVFAKGSRAEQPLTGVVAGAVVTGIVDRLAVRAEGVWLVDYKTHRAAPADIADTPVRYLRQLAAYRAVLRDIYPDRPVHCALVWTDSASVAMLPGALLDLHAPQA